MCDREAADLVRTQPTVLGYNLLYHISHGTRSDGCFSPRDFTQENCPSSQRPDEATASLPPPPRRSAHGGYMRCSSSHQSVGAEKPPNSLADWEWKLLTRSMSLLCASRSSALGGGRSDAYFRNRLCFCSSVSGLVVPSLTACAYVGCTDSERTLAGCAGGAGWMLAAYLAKRCRLSASLGGAITRSAAFDGARIWLYQLQIASGFN